MPIVWLYLFATIFPSTSSIIRPYVGHAGDGERKNNHQDTSFRPSHPDSTTLISYFDLGRLEKQLEGPAQVIVKEYEAKGSPGMEICQ